MSHEIVNRTCTQCAATKPASEFTWKDRGKRLSSRCHECKRQNYKENPGRARERSRNYYAANRAAVLQRDKVSRRSNVASQLLMGARWRAKRYGLPFDLVLADVVVTDVCPVLGIAMTVNDGRCGPNSPTLDRIVPSRGYVRGNVVVISHRANTIKNDATLDELRKVIAFMEHADKLEQMESAA